MSEIRENPPDGYMGVMMKDHIPYFIHENGVTVCAGCGCELGSGQPDPPRKYAGHTDDCPFMIELYEPCEECGEIRTHKGTCSYSAMHNPNHSIHNFTKEDEHG